jgi:hypothetical protein
MAETPRETPTEHELGALMHDEQPVAGTQHTAGSELLVAPLDRARSQVHGAKVGPNSWRPWKALRENVNLEDLGASSQDRSGITKRPIEEEQREQQDLPQRGEN